MKTSRPLAVWGIFRVPALLALLYLFREPIIDAVERTFDIVGLTLYAIDVFSTPVTRILFGALVAAAVIVGAFALKRLSPTLRFAVLAAGGSALLLAAFLLTSSPLKAALLACVLLTFNLIPDAVLDRAGKSTDRFIGFAAGFAELFLFRRYVAWVLTRLGHRAPAMKDEAGVLTSVLPATLVPCAFAMLTIDSELLVPYEQRIRSGPELQVVAAGDFNWIELDESQQHLFATGHGVARLRRYDIAEPGWPHAEADVDTGAAQSFGYDPQARELYVYHPRLREVIYLDATDLKKKRAVSLEELSPGDPWIVADSRTDTLTIASEADVQQGYPFLVLNRSSGAVLDRRQEDPGNIILDPSESVLFLSYFRRTNDLKRYNLRTLEFDGGVPTDKRVDRLALHEPQNELLIASPLTSQIVRYDSRTLTELGRIDAVFAVRVIAVDERRNLLISGSLATGVVAVIDMASERTLKKHYVGPWLRSIVLRDDAGTAYISSNGALYELEYGNDFE